MSESKMLSDEELEELERKQLVASDASRLLSSLKHEREENERLRGYEKLHHGCDALLAAHDKLKAENDRLREALKEITRWVVDKEVTGPTSVAMHTIARRALTGDGEGREK